MVFWLLTIQYESDEWKISALGCIIEGQPWFLGTDIGECLGYANPRRAYLDHTEEKYRKALKYKGRPDSGRADLWGENDFMDKIVISEAGMFQMIFESQTEAAATFRDWVYEEVLPSIRKNGGYIVGQEALDNICKQYIKDLGNQLKPEFIRLEYFG